MKKPLTYLSLVVGDRRGRERRPRPPVRDQATAAGVAFFLKQLGAPGQARRRQGRAGRATLARMAR